MRTALDYGGGHKVRLLSGGGELFPAIEAALAQAKRQACLVSYIFNDDPAALRLADALAATAARGVEVCVVVDGFGSNGCIAALRERFQGTKVGFEVFRPLDRWWAWLQPGQLRRLHQKLCAVDGLCAFVGGINIVDDRFDIHHGWSEAPRLDFAVQVEGPVAAQVQHLSYALWSRARLGRGWREEIVVLARSAEPVEQTLELVRELRSRPPGAGAGRGRRALDALRRLARPESTAWEPQQDLPPVRAALVVRDNVTQRRAIERLYVQAIGRAQHSVDIACSYFYPGRSFRRALRRAAARGVRIRLLMQGRIDYRIAALAARALYDEMLSRGIRIFEYTPAFLHAKVAVVDGHWVTVGSSNIDPLSLWLNLEANVVVMDPALGRDLGTRLDAAFAASSEITASHRKPGLRAWLSRGLVAWLANIYLRIGGITGRY